MNNEIRLTRDEEREIDSKLGPGFKKQMNEFADKLADLMMEFPMAQGHSKYAQYLRQPFSMMSGAVHLVRRFGMSEAERDKDDAILSSIPSVLDSLAKRGEDV
jgi:hypothetical protein